uniref:Uncharacterized protein n=1 Tax=Picea glauca TaxID=3330 RepID=A0A117NJ22_PICGL|nr:hypothetical protein ABT39_MTgene654 [Picea glauca]
MPQEHQNLDLDLHRIYKQLDQLLKQLLRKVLLDQLLLKTTDSTTDFNSACFTATGYRPAPGSAIRDVATRSAVAYASSTGSTTIYGWIK